jgi:hypothetical protein
MLLLRHLLWRGGYKYWHGDSEREGYAGAGLREHGTLRRITDQKNG